MYGILSTIQARLILDGTVDYQARLGWLTGWLAPYLDRTRIGKLILHSPFRVFRISSKCADLQPSLHNHISALRLGNFTLCHGLCKAADTDVKYGQLIESNNDALQSLEPQLSSCVPSQERDGLDTTALALLNCLA